MKNINAFKDFLANEVNLNQSRIDTLEQKIESIKTFLKDNLDFYRKVEKQGSYAMQTIIKPVNENNEFDADLLIYCKKIDSYEPADYIKTMYNAFKDNGNYSEIVKRKTRCITLDYSGDFHIDLVPCIEDNDEVFICNYKENNFEKSDGTGYRQWLTEKTNYSNGELKRITRLFKFLRDHKTTFSVKSILLTTLLGSLVENISQSKFSDIPTALLNIMKVLNDYLQSNYQMPIIKNPVLPEEDFNRNWTQELYETFRNKINDYFAMIEEAYNEEDHNASVKKWRKIFGDKFGTLIGNNSNSKVAIIPTKPHSTGWNR